MFGYQKIGFLTAVHKKGVVDLFHVHGPAFRCQLGKKWYVRTEIPLDTFAGRLPSETFERSSNACIEDRVLSTTQQVQERCGSWYAKSFLHCSAWKSVVVRFARPLS